ncbi:MAG TPA: vitamin K epoxide reductase family protein [Gemmatimonadales bacterium]|nr:vitamin K epoxide reductase family protein [Gemmatimonadales bacterium]
MRRRQTIAILALAGLFVALYLWLHKIGLIGELQCGTGSCEIVQASRYADLLGFPVALYGVIGYAVIFAAALVSVQPRWLAARGPGLALVALSSLGFAFTVYLTAVSLLLIHATCRWCLASGAIMTTIWLLSLATARRPT